MNDEVFLSDDGKLKEDISTKPASSLILSPPELELHPTSEKGTPSTTPSPTHELVLTDSSINKVKVGSSGDDKVAEDSKLREAEDDVKLKQSENGTLLSRGGEFGAEENANATNLNDSALTDLQTTSDIRFFICGSCKNNPILIGSTPKLLPCLHSFCENCLQDRYEKQRKSSDVPSSAPRLKCPSCGQEFLVAANDHPTSGFLNNQFVIESTPNNPGKNESDTHQCTSCDDSSTATSYCMNCNEWLCEVCVSAHQRVKVTKDHIIQQKSSQNSPTFPIPDPSTPAAKEKPLFCKVHSHEQLKLFCANCDKLTCRDCQLVEHKDHRYQFIDEAASKHREILKKLLQYLQINLGLLKETIVDVEKVSDGLSYQEKDIEANINKAFQSLIDSIKVRQDHLVKELKNLVLTKQALLAKQKKDLTQMRVILEHNHDFAEFAVKGGSNVALLYSRKVLGTRLHNLNSLKYRQRPLALTDLKFSMDVDKLCSYFSKIGAVYSHEDMQRKIDHYNTKTPTSTAPRTMALSSSRAFSKNQQTPIESLAAINKRISDSTAVTSSTAYINLSKQGTLGLPGHQTIRSASASPKNYNNFNQRHSISNANQEMIVLSSSNTRSISSSDSHHPKKDLSTKYIQLSQERSGSNQSNKTPTHEKNLHSTYHSHHRHTLPVSHTGREYNRHYSVNSPHRERHPNWSKLEHAPTKNSTIDQLRKMVEGTSTVSPHQSSATVDTNVTRNARLSVNESNSNHLNHIPSNVMIKEENKSPEAPTFSMRVSPVQEDVRCESGFDEGQSNEDYCGVCRNGGQLLCCDTCPKVYHLNCHIPALSDLPSDSWSCGLCFEVGQDSRTGQKRRHSDGLSEWELKTCEKILLSLFVHVDSLPFHHKVSKLQVPDYYKVISKPMDLMTVLTKLNPQHFEHYKCTEDFIADIKLVLSNCFIYNSADSDVCKMGRRLESSFENLLKKFVPEVSSYPDSEQLKVKRRKEDSSYGLI